MGSVQYGPLQTHAFVCTVHKGVMDEPLVYALIRLYGRQN